MPEDAWNGLPNTSAHRTVGGHRAWCYRDREWCRPKALCQCCDQTTVPEPWRDEYTGAVLRDLYDQVEALPVLLNIPSGRGEYAVLMSDVLALINGRGGNA